MKIYRWNGCWLSVVSISIYLILVVGCTSQEQTEKSSHESYFVESAKADAAKFPGEVIQGSKDTFFNKNNRNRSQYFG